jgi:hypothetical protein
MMQSKYERKTTQRLLATTQIADVLPAFLRRHDAEQDAFAERIERVDQLQFGVTAHGNHLVHFLELSRDLAEAFHETLKALPAQVIEEPLGGVAGGNG